MQSAEYSAKYDAEVNLDESSSHTLIAKLVGEGRRVLDVGCATGYLAEALRGLGCQVSGVEYDEQMAEQARAHVDRLEVGDVERMDLVDLFGAGSFDVVVFGDVLEHLTGPEEVLRRLRPVLAPGGAVVASIPNVGHGAVRLSLLDGRFDYTETGLLDRTHLRFYTRDSVLRLFADAGYATVALQRTKLGVFDTEIPLSPADVDPGVVDRVLDDPEATTYQFVVRAVPADEADPAEVERFESEDAVERQRREAAADDHAAVTGLTAQLPTVPPASIALWGGWDDDGLSTGLLARVVPAELASRLPGVLVRLFAPHGDARGGRLALGEPLEPLGRLGGPRAALLADGVDGVLVLGRVEVTPEGVAAWYGGPARRSSPALVLATGLPDAAVPVLWGPVRLDGVDGPSVALAPGDTPLERGSGPRALPDPALLAPRVYEPAACRSRADYLRAMDWYPPHGRVLAVHASAAWLPRVDEVAGVLGRLLDERPGVSLALLELEPAQGDASFANALAVALQRDLRICPVDAGVDGLVAGIAQAAAVASTGATPLALAAGFGVPSVALDEVSPDDLLARLQEALDAPAPAPSAAPAGVAELDAWFDEVVERLRPAEPPTARVLDVSTRYAALERAHAAMRARTTADVQRALEARPEPEPIIVDSSAELAQVKLELERLNNTKTMRALRPARELYSRARARLR